MHPSTALLHRMGAGSGVSSGMAVISTRCVTVVEADGAAQRTLPLSLQGRPTAVTELSAGLLLVSDSMGGLYTLDLRGRRVCHICCHQGSSFRVRV